ncbi:uncharacterized protein [Spinacia oleracea]|uniref:DUF8039 domain-containing protein n=1 Tax=Spinacia oleracea TaxID=3562 RepID=A0A9R0I618_SPIOL|nr:uncharacterized protein LOC110783204 [Spinacia oleracea]
MKRDNYRVSVDNTYSDYAIFDLPVETDDGVTKLGEAKGYFVEWPVDMVFFVDKGETTPKKAKSISLKETVDSCGYKSGESSTVKGKGGKCSELSEKIVEILGDYCSMLYYYMISGEGDYDTTSISLKAPLFYQDQDKQFFLTSTDVYEFLREAWANVSLIHVYILFLVEERISLFQISEIKFQCPQRISAAEIKSDPSEVSMYLRNAFLAELNKKDAHCKFILASYYEECRLKGNAFKKSKVQLLFIRMECAQQRGSTKCGYYVMRYMYEIVSSHRYCKDKLQEEYMERDASYNDEEINEVREQWAKFFRITYLLKD